MKELYKAIPFCVALLVVLSLFATRPSEETHIQAIKGKYVQSRMAATPRWWFYKRHIEHHDYLFFTVVKHKHEIKSIGFWGIVYYRGER